MTLTIDDIVTTLAVISRLKDSPRFGEIGRTDLQGVLVLADARRRDRETLPMNVFALRLGVSRAAMTTIADRLEQYGLAERRYDVTDRRRILIAITDDGYTALADALDTPVAA